MKFLAKIKSYQHHFVDGTDRFRTLRYEKNFLVKPKKLTLKKTKALGLVL